MLEATVILVTLVGFLIALYDREKRIEREEGRADPGGSTGIKKTAGAFLGLISGTSLGNYMIYNSWIPSLLDLSVWVGGAMLGMVFGYRYLRQRGYLFMVFFTILILVLPLLFRLASNN